MGLVCPVGRPCFLGRALLFLSHEFRPLSVYIPIGLGQLCGLMLWFGASLAHPSQSRVAICGCAVASLTQF